MRTLSLTPERSTESEGAEWGRPALMTVVRTEPPLNAPARRPICGRMYEAAVSVLLPVVVVVMVMVGYSPRNLRLLVGDSPMASSVPRVIPCVRLMPT